MKLFLDTNVLIDYFVQRQPFFESIRKLRIAQIFGDVELWASIQSFPDIEYVLRKTIPVSDLRIMFKKCLAFVNIAAPAVADLAEGASSSCPDLEDFIIYACARRVKADYVITRDKAGFRSSSIDALSPAEWLALMESKGIVYDEIDFDAE